MTNNKPRSQDRPVEVRVELGMLRVTLADGREIATPLAWYPGLLNASPEALADVRFTVAGIHWPQLDEDLSVAGMLNGIPAGPMPSQPRDA